MYVHICTWSYMYGYEHLLPMHSLQYLQISRFNPSLDRAQIYSYSKMTYSGEKQVN